METKSHELIHGWTLVGHKSYDIYCNKANSYAVMDIDSDVVMRFITQENEIEILASNWDLNYKLNIGLKTIKILTDPEEE
ncbi:hypothetical protein [Bacillus sp. CECT 9360]|uniref:hypothetical protein n=1 Tax=Bacillus sp. CECT 9360 TaxID=2845821 RepID=UPI001E4B8503|nr:hypothetical protein [Bacillus sp. CECT 9360]CAH0347457.1 hypothetical protein BCI9360_03856 [Bacillus sp. CECT 9360]